ncbi:MAG: FAD-dependent oxidoreductase, partial [Cyclobacteriaceae bacterium]|nr:FAD-dependent oxidoreductase [Cyclobacteriaceae bacterium]
MKLKEKVKRDEHFIARGNGRSYGDASLGSTIYNTLNYNKILKLDTDQGAIIAESGTLLSEILNVIIPSGWFLPVTPGTKYVTIG